MTVEPLLPRDVSEVARLQRICFAGSPNAMLGPMYAWWFVRYFANRNRGIGLVARHDGRVVGYVLGAPIDYRRSLRWWVALPALLGMIRHPSLLQQAPSGLKARKHNDEEDVVSLIAIGVHPDYRGQGVGDRLLELFEVAAEAVGMLVMQLTMQPDNQPAAALYRRHGWQQDGTRWRKFIKESR